MKTSKMLTTLALASSLSTFAHTHDSSKETLTIDASGKYQGTMKYLQKKGIDILGVDIRNEIIDVNVDSDEMKELRNLKLLLTKNEVKGNKRLDQRYLNPTEIESFVKNIHAKYPTITKLVKAGESLEGRAIWAIKISDNAAIKEDGESAVLFNGMHHSREVMTAEVTTDIISYLTKNYATDAKVKSWVDNNEIWVLPMLNVDGNTKVWEGSNMWRKNARGGYGVDINRNYPAGWNSCNGSSGWRHSQTYRGDAPASEPETHVLMNLVSAIKPVFNISYHAYSELVIYPMGCQGQRTENREVVEGIGKKMGEVLDYVPGTAWETLYSVDGSDIDWMYEAEQVIPYVIEVSPRSDGFQPAYEKRDATVERNRVGWQLLLDRMAGSGVQGMVKPNSFKTIEVSKVVKGQTNKIQDYRINPNGSFHIVLTPGTYQLNFQGEGINQVKEVVVADKKITL